VQITVDGETFYVELEGLTSMLHPLPSQGPASKKEVIARSSPRYRSAPTSSSDTVLRSPMSGRVISVMVRPGDHVSVGEEVCVVEAMKMEQSIQTTHDGVVKIVHVKPMDSVNAHEALIELE
jgi:propionyl-CoA carboxylase alpha chain